MTLAVGLLCCSAAQAGLVVLPLFYDSNDSYAESIRISPDGQTVTGTLQYEGTAGKGFRWTHSGGVEFLDSGGTLSISAVRDVANNGISVGQVVYGTTQSGGFGRTMPAMQAGIWNGLSGAPIVPAVPPPSTYESTATAVSANGAVAVGYQYNGGSQGIYLHMIGALGPGASLDGYLFGTSDVYAKNAVRWSNGQAELLRRGSDNAHVNSRAFGVSNDGSVIVGNMETPTSPFEWGNPFIWTASTGMVAIDVSSQPYRLITDGISGDGQFIFGHYFAGLGVWRCNQSTGFQVLPSSELFRPRDASFDGSIIVGRLGTQGATVWTQTTGTVPLTYYASLNGFDFGGLFPAIASGISDDGKTIVGLVTPDGGNTYNPFILTIPEPGAILLSLIPSVLLIRRRAETHCA